MALSFSSISSVVFMAWAIWKFLYTMGFKKHGVHPPGPKPLPFIGNLLDFPTRMAALTYTEWEKKYKSPILYAEALGNHILILNSVRDAEELLECHDRAQIYSDRPVWPLVTLMGWERNVAIMPYGDVWRRHRRILQNNFSKKAVQQMEPVQTRKIHELLQGLLRLPDKFEAHSKMLSASLSIWLMYGYEVKSIDDPCVTMADEALSLGTRLLVPGASLLNVFPLLGLVPEWFPGAYSCRMAAKVRRMTAEVIKFPLEHVKKSLETGTLVPSLVGNFYERQHTVGASQEEEEIIGNVAYTVYGAAADTTIAFTGSFFYLMAVNPDAQRKAHAELDRVTGLKRLPTLADRESLPYIEAMYREVLRLRPPLPLGVPHCATEDNYFKGYFIPKGTAIFPNIWAMSHDENIYPDPDAFKPERYFDAKGNLRDEKLVGYGFGRRVCVGECVASSTVWLGMMASVLACFEITNKKDEYGNDIEVNGDIEDNGLMNHKSEFECAFHPRLFADQKMSTDVL